MVHSCLLLSCSVHVGEIDEKDVEKSLKKFLVGDEPIAGVILKSTGEKVTLQQAFERKLIKRSKWYSTVDSIVPVVTCPTCRVLKLPDGRLSS